MNDNVNGSENPAVLPQAIKAMQAAVPDCGPMWEVRHYQHPTVEHRKITGIFPPALSPEQPRFYSTIPIVTNRGPAEIGFTIVGATTLEQAIEGWQSSARLAIEEMYLQNVAQQKRIIVPDAAERAGLPTPKLVKH